ncbi:MAG: hypothetical protein ACLP1Y_10080 [Candidatus Acidiferrales bacterium]
MDLLVVVLPLLLPVRIDLLFMGRRLANRRSLRVFMAKSPPIEPMHT